MLKMNAPIPVYAVYKANFLYSGSLRNVLYIRMMQIGEMMRKIHMVLTCKNPAGVNRENLKATFSIGSAGANAARTRIDAENAKNIRTTRRDSSLCIF